MSLRRHIEQRLPQREALSNSRWLRRFAHLLHEPWLWHFGRRSVARSAGYGLALAFFPLPIHMLLVFPLAFLRRLNLPVTVGALWVTNPVTWVPFFYFAYRVGLLFTGEPARPAESLPFAADWASIRTVLEQIWLPLSLGSLVCGLVAGLVGYVTINACWRLSILRRWRSRSVQRRG